jgi:hypothetical protein
MKFALWNMILRSPEGEGAGEAAPPAPDFSSFAEVLNTSGGTSGTPPAEDGAGAGAGEAEAKASAPAGEAPPPADPAGTPLVEAPARAEGEGDDVLAGLRQQVQQFLSKAPKEQAAPEAPRAEAVQQQPEAPKEAKPGEGAKPQGYNLHVPDQILAAMESDDREVRRQGMGALVNGMMNILARDFAQALTYVKEELGKELPKEAATRATAEVQQQRIREDFYSAFPKIKELVTAMPAIEGSIWQQVYETGQKMGQKQWTPEFRDGVGAMIHLALGIPVPMKAAAAAQTKSATGRQPARGQFSAGGSPSRGNGVSQGNEYMEVLNAGTG